MTGANAIVLLSGGIDSSTTLAIAMSEGFDVYAMTFRYGQRHEIELEAAGRIAEAFHVFEHRIVNIDLRGFGGSALTDDIEVPTDRDSETMNSAIPITYVPGRNTLFLSYAVAWAEVIGAFDIFLGVNAMDYPGYPDCRPEYIVAYETMANLATKVGGESGKRLRIHAPLIMASKADIIRRGLELDVDYGLTSTCYAPSSDGAACGRCDACQLRKDGFAKAGVEDPTEYANLDESRT